MALIKCANGIVEIRGTSGGNVFSQDKSGLHIQAHQRRIKSHSLNQHNVRKSFRLARIFSTDNREVSYNIYRGLNNLQPTNVPSDYPTQPF